MRDSEALLPVDRWVALVNVLLLCSWLPLVPRLPSARWFAAVHLGALALPWLLRRVQAPLSQVTAGLRETYPLLWTAMFWSELGLRHDLLPEPINDPLVAGWDLQLFGTHLNLSWVETMPSTAMSEVMQGAYFTYYLMLAAIPLVLLAGRDLAIRREVVLRIAVSYLGCFLIYSYFPVVGPRELWPIYQGDLTSGFFYQLNLGLRSAGDSLGTAFPSSHTVGAVTFAWIAWRTGRPGIASLVTVLAGLIALATVYTQNHFAIDTVAGLVVAGFLQAVVVPSLTGLVRQRQPHSVLLPSGLPEAT